MYFFWGKRTGSLGRRDTRRFSLFRLLPARVSSNESARFVPVSGRLTQPAGPSFNRNDTPKPAQKRTPSKHAREMKTGTIFPPKNTHPETRSGPARAVGLSASPPKPGCLATLSHLKVNGVETCWDCREICYFCGVFFRQNLKLY
ncbi:MAG: hypothetical protein D6714_08700 [Bacteroidetes bacterium]|nr:MAG: hypothetical protein D6714_08700 [Bacteroidota bacterium]